jgi:hypothetical protein
MRRKALAALLLLALLGPAAASFAQGDAEGLREAKALFFDRDYGKAREAWRAVARAGGSDRVTALFWIARCSEKLKESERALAEYGEFLAAGAADRTLVEEAKTSRVAIAVEMDKRGDAGQLGIAREALSDPSPVVRYFAALRMASLDPEVGRPAVPVLKEIIAREKDEDLVERAKLGLLRLDRQALAEASPVPPSGARGKKASWVRVRIYEKGKTRPQVAINVPVALAELVFKALPDQALAKLRAEGYDARTFWEKVKQTGPAEILTIESEDGERIQVWIE